VSGEKKKVVIEVSEGVVSVITSRSHNSTKLEAEISSAPSCPKEKRK
jgi:hypothetical protein